MSLSPGGLVGGRYVVQREIASGGMGTVYAVHNQEDGRAYALKVLKKTDASVETTLDRFRREAQLLDSLDHPSVVKMMDAGLTEDGAAFLVMELLEGETLLDYLRREAPVAPAALAPIVRGMAIGLDAIHERFVIHRDLKPSNVFVTPDGVKLVDFGVARGVDLVRLTITGQVIGTVRYMSPEQLAGRTELDGRSDVYSMGLIVWSALAGGPPHSGTIAVATLSILDGTPRLDEVAPAVGPELAAVVHRAIAVSRDQRFATAGEFAAAFERAAAQVGADPRWSSPTGFAPLPSTRVALPSYGDEHLDPTIDAPATLVDPPRMAPPQRASSGWVAALAIAALVLVVVVAALSYFLVMDSRHVEPAPVAPVELMP